MNKFLSFLCRCEDIFVFLVFLLLFLIGSYSLADSWLVYEHANDDSILKFRPGYEGEVPDRKISDDMVAWLTIDGTSINYPVMQGRDNMEYLNKDPYGEYSLSGSIFLDFRNSPDFSDDYSLIYGHHMEGGAMFGSLGSFLQQKYFRSHSTGTLTVHDKAYPVHIFASLTTQATDSMIFSPTLHSASELFSYVSDKSIISDENFMNKAKEEGRLIALSTCQYPETADRVIVFLCVSQDQ